MFHQDDAHIFCTMNQLKEEIQSNLKMIHRTYSILKFDSYELALSTRPENAIGNVEKWEEAERILRQVLNEHSSELPAGWPQWTIKEGDGAFYGPKIDIMVKDACGRKHQLGTIQLDFQLPERFDLTYQAEDGSFQRPVMVHRAVYGSLERMLGILTEHYGGKWPFWLSPRQVKILPIHNDFNDYAHHVSHQLKTPSFLDRLRLNVDVDDSDRSLSKKIKETHLQGYNYIAIVGQAEKQNQTVTLKSAGQQQTYSLKEIKSLFAAHIENFE
jgi:threonyl-tRNA synthetase